MLKVVRFCWFIPAFSMTAQCRNQRERQQREAERTLTPLFLLLTDYLTRPWPLVAAG